MATGGGTTIADPPPAIGKDDPNMVDDDEHLTLEFAVHREQQLTWDRHGRDG